MICCIAIFSKEQICVAWGWPRQDLGLNLVLLSPGDTVSFYSCLSSAWGTSLWLGTWKGPSVRPAHHHIAPGTELPHCHDVRCEKDSVLSGVMNNAMLLGVWWRATSAYTPSCCHPFWNWGVGGSKPVSHSNLSLWPFWDRGGSKNFANPVHWSFSIYCKEARMTK